MSLDAIQAALHGWLSTATGLPVQFQEQDGPQPAGDYCTLRLGSTLHDGAIPTQEWREVGNAPPGQDLEVGHWERVRIPVTAQAYTAASLGNASALAVLERARQVLVLAEVLGRLKSVGGVAVHRRGDVRNLNTLAGPRWQGRAALELEINVVQVVTERTTYIATTDTPVVEGG